MFIMRLLLLLPLLCSFALAENNTSSIKVTRVVEEQNHVLVKRRAGEKSAQGCGQHATERSDDSFGASWYPEAPRGCPCIDGKGGADGPRGPSDAAGSSGGIQNSGGVRKEGNGGTGGSVFSSAPSGSGGRRTSGGRKKGSKKRASGSVGSSAATGSKGNGGGNNNGNGRPVRYRSSIVNSDANIRARSKSISSAPGERVENGSAQLKRSFGAPCVPVIQEI